MTDLKSKKYSVIFLGCDKNRVDSEKVISFIQEQGCEVTGDLKEAQVIIVNTCAFINDAREESINTVIDCNALREEGHLEKLVVSGCLPQKFLSELFDTFTEADIFLGVNDYDRLFDALQASYDEDERLSLVGQGQFGYRLSRAVSEPEHIAYLKIADGCNNRCTYCLIPKIRGRYISYPMEDLISEAESLGDVSELIIVAQDITRYGMDLYGQPSLVPLLRRLSTLDNIQAIRLLYCYPDMITDELITEIATNGKILKYIDIPLQHSEDRILKLMNRPQTRKSYLELISRLRREVPGIAIRSTFIVGFPSETEEDVEGLISFLEEARIENCGFFAYSREKDTPADRLPGHMTKREKQKRLKRVYKAQEAISGGYYASYVGKTVRVLCDGISEDGESFAGHTYFQAPDIDGKTYFNAPLAEQGEWYDVQILASDGSDLYGATPDYVPED
ncbi:MAG: 30S ribosomal protein S12 methylthiotransferase RimO [Clostridia bacterium]|nr:30S ribosomal protein S12 methylthiotransferase RimO [Clostridia bacterium]